MIRMDVIILLYRFIFFFWLDKSMRIAIAGQNTTGILRRMLHEKMKIHIFCDLSVTIPIPLTDRVLGVRIWTFCPAIDPDRSWLRFLTSDPHHCLRPAWRQPARKSDDLTRANRQVKILLQDTGLRYTDAERPDLCSTDQFFTDSASRSGYMTVSFRPIIFSTILFWSYSSVYRFRHFCHRA